MYSYQKLKLTKLILVIPFLLTSTEYETATTLVMFKILFVFAGYFYE